MQSKKIIELPDCMSDKKKHKLGLIKSMTITLYFK